MDSFKIRMHNSESDNQDLCGGNPRKMGSENPQSRPITSAIYSKSQVCNSE
jgi:hypothetical protein